MTESPVRRVLVVSHAYVDPANHGKLRALAARGLEVTLAVPQRWRDAALGATVETSWERQNGVEIFPIPARGTSPLRMRYAGRALSALLRSKRPDLVHVEEEPRTAAARQVTRAARALGIPATLFTWEGPQAGGPLGRWRGRRTLRTLRGALAAGDAAAAALRHDAPGLAVAVVPQFGVHVPAAPAHRQHRGLAIACMGRLVHGKGLDTLLQALASNRSERWRLTIVGEGPARESLERLALGLRLAPRIRWAGALPAGHVTGLWPELDVLVLPAEQCAARTERSGDLVLEAMANEVAVIGTATGVIPELVGDTGLVVPAGDLARLAEALRRVADDGIRRPLAQQARQRAMRLYSNDAVAERTLDFWNSLKADR
jgi:glycosyltransferase involved in cell wall biosynthesis